MSDEQYTEVVVLRRCGQNDVVGNETDVCDVDFNWFDDPREINQFFDGVDDLRDHTIGELMHIVLQQWYQDVNCSNCRHNVGMMIPWNDGIGLGVIVDCKVSRDHVGDAVPFVIEDGVIHWKKMAYCNPDPLTDADLQQRALAKEPHCSHHGLMD